MDGIKTEYNLICHGCLSNDRRMIPLSENSKIFLSLIRNQKQCLNGSDDVKLCWECIAKLKKFKMFQTQLTRAQEVLIQILYGTETLPSSMSKLSTTTKSFYDCDMKQESTRKKRKNKYINTDDTKKHFNTTMDNHIPQHTIEWDIKVERMSEIDIEEKSEIIYTDDVPDIVDDDDNKALIMYSDKVIPDIVNIDENKADIVYSHEILPDIVDTDSKADVTYCHNMKNDTEFICDVKLEPVKHKGKRDRKVNKNTEKYNWRKRNKEFATLVETRDIDWGDFESYFTTVYFDEKEMEQHIFMKERHYADLERYQYSCTECRLGYKSQVDLKRHNNLNHRKPGAPYKCTLCHTTLPSQTDLESHWREHTRIAKCNLCCHMLRPRGMRQHLNLAHTKQYACGKCKMTFETITKYGEHFRNAHTTYTCDYCHKDFKTKSRITYHIGNMHVPTFCPDCNRPFPNQNKYLRHCILMHPLRVNRTEAQEAAFCVECNKQYNSIQQYRKHLKISPKHIEVKRQETPCPECGKTFARKHYMNNHYNLYHLKKTKFYCELCDKYFARGFGLRVHNTYVHQKMPKVRDKICDLCGRAFTSNRTMLNHRRTHTGERPHKCPYCTAEFIQKYAMQTHMRTQHKHFS